MADEKTMTEFRADLLAFPNGVKYVEQLDQPTAEEIVPFAILNAGYHKSQYEKTKMFHVAVGLRVTDDWSATPSVSERVLRGQLLIEEVFETLRAMGLDLLIDGVPFGQGFENIGVVHVEGSRYDPIETADGLADISVITNGTAVSFGIPLPLVETEVFYSNMTKLDQDGKPIVNRCQYGGSLGDQTSEESCIFVVGQDECCNTTHYIDPTKPHGKVLKPDTYTPANIARLYRQQVAPFLKPEK